MTELVCESELPKVITPVLLKAVTTWKHVGGTFPEVGFKDRKGLVTGGEIDFSGVAAACARSEFGPAGLSGSEEERISNSWGWNNKEQRHPIRPPLALQRLRVRPHCSQRCLDVPELYHIIALAVQTHAGAWACTWAASSC